MKKALLSIVLGAAAHCHASAVAPVEVTDTERERAVAHFHLGEKSDIEKIPYRHVDGVRGYGVHTTIEGGYILDGQPASRLSILACGGATFGLVQLEGAHAFAGKHNLGVFTKYQFRILDDWNAATRPDTTTIHLVMEGGEVEHRGEKVRVENLNAKYQIDRQYVLIAGRGPTVYDTPPLIEVVDDTIYPASDNAPFRSGTTIAQAKAAIGRALQKWPCK